MSRKLYDKVRGFHETGPLGYPEDLRFFYDALKIGADFIKVSNFLIAVCKECFYNVNVLKCGFPFRT